MSFKLLKEAVSILTIATFIATNSLYAASESKSVFKNKKVNYKTLSNKNEGVIQQKKAILAGEDPGQAESQKKEAKELLTSHLSDIALIHIPEELGRIVEVYQKNPGRDDSKLVVYIQDLHTNPEAEFNLAKILEILLKDYDLGLVCSEGADGAVDTSSVSSFPDADVRKKVAELFINSGELTGEEYLSITKYPELPIWGIENKEIYFKNIAEFNSIMEFNPDSQVFISQAKKALEELKSKIYSKELLDIDQKESDYEAQKAETADYLKYLSFYIQKLNIPTSSYKNIALLNDTIKQEYGIDQQKIMRESQDLLMNLQSAIAGKSNRSDMDILMAKANLFKEQKISPFSFYSYLKDLADKHLKDQLSKYPNLTGFTDYLTKVNSLDSMKLFIEMEDLTYDIKQRLAKNNEERGLTQALRNIKFLEGFFNLKVSNEELDYYLQNRDSHKVAFFEDFLKPELQKYNISSFVDFNPGLIDTHLQELEDFYSTAKSRDIVMFNNSISEIEKRNIKVTALITGGFHTRGITNLLKEKGYSYIVISPYSKTGIDEENYHFLLSGKRKPIEELIKQLDVPADNTNQASVNLRVPMTFDKNSTSVIDRMKAVTDNATQSDLDKFNMSSADRVYAQGLHDKYKNPVAQSLIIGKNFKPSALLSAEDRKNLLGAIEYDAIASIGSKQEYTDAAKNVRLICNPMNGGLGSNVSRMEYLKQIWSSISESGTPKMGTKGTDLYFEVKLEGYDTNGKPAVRNVMISVTELKYLRLISTAGGYGKVIIQELVNNESQESVKDFLKKTYLPDSLDDRISNGEKRTYGDVIEQSGKIERISDIVQGDLPTIDVATGELTSERMAPGGHGQLGTMILQESQTIELPSDGSVLIRAVYNGDGPNNAPDAIMIGWMAEERIPIVMVSTTKTGLDKKGGLIGVEYMKEGKTKAQMCELAQAKSNGQEDLFYRIGLPGNKGDEGEAGAQYFNTNMAMVNYSVLAPFLKDLKELIGEEEFSKIITPDLIKNKKEQNGKEFIQLEGALGSALLNLNGFTQTNPEAKALLKTHKLEKLLFIINVDSEDRTDFFTPIKYAFDYWLQSCSDHFVLEEKEWRIKNARQDGHLPDISEDLLQNKYYMDVSHCITAFGNASTKDFNSLDIKGIVHLKNAILSEDVVIINENEDIVDLNSENYKKAFSERGMVKDGLLDLKNVKIVINKNKEISISRIVDDKLSDQPITGTQTKLASNESVSSDLQEAVKGNKDAYAAIKNINPNDVIAYFEAGLAGTITNLPEDLFGRGYGYDIRGNALEIKGGIVDMTPANLYAIGKLLALKYLKPGDGFLVTGDMRMHTPILRYAMALGAASVGADVDFSEEALSSGAHNVYSAENPKGYKVQVQLSGSHGVYQKNGAKIKAELGNNRLDPVYGGELADLYFKRGDILGKAEDRNVKDVRINEVSGIEDAIVKMYDSSLPPTTGEEILVIDTRAGAGGSLASKLFTKRGYEIIDMDEVLGILGQADADVMVLLEEQGNVDKFLSRLNELWARGAHKIVFMLNMHPDPLMRRGIWDPSQPVAMKPTMELVKAINKNLQEGMPQAFGGAYDGDADRVVAVKEDGIDIPAFEMTMPYYQRFLLDPKNKAAIIAMVKAGSEPLWLACDVRANSALKAMIDKLNNIIKTEGKLSADPLKSVYVNTGYPPQLAFIAWRIEKMKAFVNSRSELRDNPEFMVNFTNLIHTYYTAEASGHNFFHASPGNPERPCDCAVAALVSLINIKETMDDIEGPALGIEKGSRAPLVTLFEKFPSTFTSKEIQVGISNHAKISTAHKLGAWLEEEYGSELLKQRNEKERIGSLEMQPVEDGLVTVAGYKAQFEGKGSILIRWSNTGEQLTLLFEGRDLAALIGYVEKVFNRIQREIEMVPGLDLGKFQDELTRLKKLQEEKMNSAEKPVSDILLQDEEYVDGSAGEEKNLIGSNDANKTAAVTESEIMEIRRELARETREVVVMGGGSGTNFFSKPIKKLGWQRISVLTPFDSGGRTGKIKEHVAVLSNREIDFFAAGDISKVICEQAPSKAIREVMNTKIAEGEAGPDSSKNFTAKIKEILNDVLLSKISGTDTRHFDEYFVRRLIEAAKKVDDVFNGFDLKGHSPRHLIFAALILYKTEKEHKGYQRSIEEGTSEFLELVDINNKNDNVFLSSVDKKIGKVVVEREIKEPLEGQFEITKEDPGAISSISVEPDPEANIEAIKKLESLQRGDMIIIGPGSFYTSIMVNMLPEGMVAAIKEAREKGVICIFALNPIFENETIAMKSRDEGVFVHMLEKVREHAGIKSIGELFDYIIANDFRRNTSEVADLVTKESAIKGDKKFERSDKNRIGGIGQDNVQEIPKLIEYLKEQPLGVSLVTGNLLEVIHTSSVTKEVTFSPGKFENILKAISQDHALSRIAEIIVISDPHATTDALAKIKKSLPQRDVFAAGDLMDRGDELWNLMRLVNRFVLGDHEGWAMGAGLGHDYLLALWLRSLYRYPETIGILEEFGIDAGNFVEFANEYYDENKLKTAAKKKGDKYKGPKTPEEQAMFNIWIKLALQKNDADTMKAVTVKDSSGNVVRRNILLNIKLNNKEKKALDQVEVMGDDEVKKLINRLKAGAYLDEAEKNMLLNSAEEGQKIIIADLITRSNKISGKDELQELTEEEKAVFEKLKNEFLKIRTSGINRSISKLMKYLFRGGMYDVISPIPVLDMDSEDLNGISLCKPGKFPKALILHALPAMKNGKFADLYGEPLLITLKAYYDQLYSGILKIEERYNGYLENRITQEDILTGYALKVSGKDIKPEEFLRLLIDTEYAPLFARRQTRTHTYIDDDIGEPDNKVYAFMTRNHEADEKSGTLKKAALNENKDDRKEIKRIKIALAEYGVSPEELLEKDGFLYIKNEEGNSKIAEYVLRQFGAEVLITGHLEKDKAHKPVSLAEGKLWMIDPGFTKKSGKTGELASEEHGGGLILREKASVGDTGIHEVVLVKLSEILDDKENRFLAEREKLIGLLSFKEALYYSNLQISWDELYKAAYLVQDIISILTALGKDINMGKLKGEELLSRNRLEWIQYYSSLREREQKNIINEIRRGITSFGISDQNVFNQAIAKSLKDKCDNIIVDPRVRAIFSIKPKRFVMPVYIDGQLQSDRPEVTEMDVEIMEDPNVPTVEEVIEKRFPHKSFRAISFEDAAILYAGTPEVKKEMKQTIAEKERKDMDKRLASNANIADISAILNKLKNENVVNQLDNTVYGKTFEEVAALNPKWAAAGFDKGDKKDPSRFGWTLANLKWILENPDKIQQVLNDAEEIRAKYKYVIFCGMGGSGLSVQTVKTTFGEKKVKIYSLRTTDPAAIKYILENEITKDAGSLQAALLGTLVKPISKSGKTEETVSHKKYFEKLYADAKIDIKDHMWVVTDKGSPMDTGDYTQREIQLNGKGDIGGRFTSPTTNIFLLPLALVAPEKVNAVLEKAKAMNEIGDVDNDTFIKLGAYLYHMASELGKDKITFMVPKELQDLPMWSEQLFEESLGKDGKGVTIFYGENISEASLKDVGKNDRVFLRINAEGKKTNDELWKRLEKEGYPVFEINVDDIDSIGGIMLGLQRAVATIGYLWDICFVNQPAVEGYKKATIEVMSKLNPGEKVKVPSDWKNISFGKLKLYYDRLIKVGAITEKELEIEVQRLGATMDDAPAVYAGIINILNAKPGFEAKEFASYGRMTEGMKSILQSARTDIFTNSLKMPSKLGEGPDKNHSYQQNIEGGKDMWLSTYFMPLDVKQPEALSYDDNLIKAQTLGTVNSIVNRGRKVMLVTFDSTVDEAEKDLGLFFEKVDSFLNASSKSANPFLLFQAGRDRGNLAIDKKTIFIGMGGGDTAGLNDFIADTVERLARIGYKVLGIRNGFKGFLRGAKLEDSLVELTPEIAASMKGLPSIVLGSCREKLKEEDIVKIVDILQPSAGAIFIGGNDHLKNVEQIAGEVDKRGIKDVFVIGAPKSIDNDFMTAMHGFWSAVITGRQIAARASINPENSIATAAVFECMGRNSGSLTLEISKGCHYSHAVIVPEKHAKIDDIINAANGGVRNFFVSEGFSLSESDPKLSQLLEAYPTLRTMWIKSKTSPDRDVHGNPKLLGASLFVKGILELFCGLNVEKTDLTYQLRGALLQPDNKGVVFDAFLADKLSEKAVSLIETKQGGLVVTYDEGYGNTEGEAKAKPPREVYKFINLSSTMSDESLADFGVLGVSGYQIKYDATPELFSERKVALETAVREAFYGIAASTFAHRYASVVELREPSDVIISSCGPDQSDIDKLPYNLKTVIEGTKGSVLLLIPENPKNLSQIADSIEVICDKSGYINIAISKDFMLDSKDELLENVLNADPILRVMFAEGLVDEKTGMVKFESGVSRFIVGLYKYLIKQGRIKVDGARNTNLGYSFKGLARSSDFNLGNRLALDSGV